MTNTGWVKLHRKMLDNPIMLNAELLQLFIYCLLRANHEPAEFIWNGKMISVGAGSFITGRYIIAKDLKQNPSTIYKRLKNLVTLGYISLKSNNKFSLLTIKKYSAYQMGNSEKEQQSNNKVTTKEQQSSTNKNDKNDKNEESVLQNTHSFDKVTLKAFTKAVTSEPFYKTFDMKYYYETIRNHSAAKGLKVKDWVAYARKWIHTDFHNGKEIYNPAGNQKILRAINN